MTSDEYRSIIAALGWSQVEAGARLGVDARTSRRWAADGPPPTAALALRLLLAAHEGRCTWAAADRLTRELV